MIVSRPSISTTGPAAEVSRRKYGRRSCSFAASSCSSRSWLRAFSKTSTAALAVSLMGEVDPRREPATLVGVAATAHRTPIAPRIQKITPRTIRILRSEPGRAPLPSDPWRKRVVGCREMAGVSIRPVRSRRDLKRFVKVPFHLHRDHPQWVPPLILDRMQFLNRGKNPFFEHAEAEYFLAERDGEPVGRITAQFDRRWDEFQGGEDGMFGFFESVDDPEVAEALLAAAEEWLRERRPQAPARADGLHHQRRGRAPDRGLRDPADDPPELAPPLLPRPDRRRRLRARRWTS